MGKGLKTKHASESRRAALRAAIDRTCSPREAEAIRTQMRKWRNGEAPYAATRGSRAKVL